MYVKTCLCGTSFETTSIRRSRCKKGCSRTGSNNSRNAKVASHEVTFIGVDGEGVTRPDGQHDYVMLSVGSRTLFNGGKQLQFQEIMAFLWESYIPNQDSVFVGFFLGYDFCQWQKMLPEHIAASLLTSAGIEARKIRRANGDPTPDPVVWEGWEFDMLAGRRFKMRPHIHKSSQFDDTCRTKTCMAPMASLESVDPDQPRYIPNGEMQWSADTSQVGDELSRVVWSNYIPKVRRTSGGSVRRPWLYICDTGPFWQASFLSVIDPKAWDIPVCTPQEFAIIVKGKSERDTIAAHGDVSYADKMQRYNILENEVLARITARLNAGFMNEHIPIRIPKQDWYGPGRAAQIWIDNLSALIVDPDRAAHNRGVPRYQRVNEYGLANLDVYASMPDWAYQAAKCTYYGGWFEIFMHGHIGNAWEYDINSAYPAIIATLPCLHTDGAHNGKYRKGSGAPDHTESDYVLVHALIEGSDPYIGTMPMRTKTGNIMRPHNVRGWYWLHEITAAMEAGLIDRVTVSEHVVYTPCTCTPPFNPSTIGIERMYQLRLAVGKNSPQGKGFKLLYNSAYGKCAQSIGNPKYSNPFYASLITAGCRTMILRAIATHPRKSAAVAMVATDGVYFTSPHPTLDIDPTTLGKWDAQVKENLTLLMPGIYWDDKSRQAIRDKKNMKLKSRGINAKDLANQVSILDELFLREEMKLRLGMEYEWPTITFSVAFMMDTAKLALQRGKWNTAGSVHRNATRVISSSPHTKRIPQPYWDNGDSVVRTPVPSQGDTLDTHPYTLAFGLPEEDTTMFPGMIDRDGRDGVWNWRALVEGTL